MREKQHQIESYRNYSNEKLKNINFPVELINCTNLTCTNVEHRHILTSMYSDIITILCDTTVDSYEMKPAKRKGHITGWNRFVSGAHKSWV